MARNRQRPWPQLPTSSNRRSTVRAHPDKSCALRPVEPTRNGRMPSVSAGQPLCGAPRRNRTGDPILTIDAPQVHEATHHLMCPHNRAGERRCRGLRVGRREATCSAVSGKSLARQNSHILRSRLGPRAQGDDRAVREVALSAQGECRRGHRAEIPAAHGFPCACREYRGVLLAQRWPVTIRTSRNSTSTGATNRRPLTRSCRGNPAGSMRTRRL